MAGGGGGGRGDNGDIGDDGDGGHVVKLGKALILSRIFLSVCVYG